MIADKPLPLNAAPPLPLTLMHLDAIAAELAARGITADAPLLMAHIRNRVSRLCSAGAGNGGEHGDNR